MNNHPPIPPRSGRATKALSDVPQSLRDPSGIANRNLPRAPSRLRQRSVFRPTNCVRQASSDTVAWTSLYGDESRSLESVRPDMPERCSSSLRQALISAAKTSCFEALPKANPVECPGDAIFSYMASEKGSQSVLDRDSPSGASKSDFVDLGDQAAFLGGHNAHDFYPEEYTDDEEEEGRITMDITITQKPRGKPMVTRQTRSSILSSDFIASCNYTADICEYITFFGVFDPWKNNMLPYWDKIFYNEPAIPFCPINPYTPSYFTCGHYPNRKVLFQPPITDPIYPPNLLRKCPDCPRINRKCCPLIV